GSFFAASVGGGIDNFGGATLTVTGSTFTANQALGAPAPPPANLSVPPPQNFGIGGAIENNAGLDLAHPSTATISDCVFTGNVASGVAGSPGGGVSGNGGAVDNEGPGTTMTLTNSTFRDNQSAGVDGEAAIPVSFGNAEGLGGGLMNFAGSTCYV